ncbi:MAG: rhomboid family intramembrane serine protease [Sandaracinaceae bacterium]|nr:rhomboid family intramembrane serine protease [Sandaracinaceae bacterium]
MTLPPSGSGPRNDAEPRRPLAIVTIASGEPAAPRQHIATEEEAADARRLAGMRVAWRRKPWVTWGLLAVIAAMFVIEEWLGGSEDNIVLTRLGGQIPGEIWFGAWWRLVSSAFLHAGVLHVGLNSYVLWIVGSTQERILGSARFLAAYTFSLICASLASLFLSDADLTVGASGAVFGLFGVEAIVVFLRHDLLPSQVRKSHSRNVLINLALNIANSFQPNIATIAHFGGGLGGALIGAFLVPHRFETEARSSPAWNVVAVACALLLVAGVAAGLWNAAHSTGEVSVLQVHVGP